MDGTIDSFEDEYEFLSNFYCPCWVVLDGERYISVEHAYQAAKSLDPAVRERFQDTSSPGRAKALGQKVKLRPGWDGMKVEVMRGLLKRKFAPGTDLAAKLLATGSAQLVEGNTWKDKFWGKVKRNGEWAGQNWLGRLLMEVRDGLRGP